MHRSNKFKTYKKGNEQHLNQGLMNRRFRYSGKLNLGILFVDDFEDFMYEMGDVENQYDFYDDPWFISSTSLYPDVFDLIENNKVGVNKYWTD